jgi:tetratricopeptide (TPR) repeat protein
MRRNVIIWLFTLVLVLSFASVALSASGPGSGLQEREILQNYNRADKHFKKGLDEFRQDKFKAAKGSFEQAVNQLPQFAEAALYLGICQYKLKEYEASLENLQASKSKYMQWFALRQQIDLESYQEAQNRLSELEAALAEAKAQEQQRQQAGGMAPQRTQDIGRVQRLEREINDIKSSTPPVMTEPVIPAMYYFHCGNTLLAMKKYNEAFEEYKQAVTIEPTYGDAHHNLAIIYYMAKQYNEAWNHLELARQYGGQINPQFEAALKQQLGK